MTNAFSAAITIALLSVATSARADDAALDLARDGGFTPGVLRARAERGGFVNLATGWNGAQRQATVDLIGEVDLVGPLRAIVRVAGELGTAAKPGAGLGVQWLDEAKHGVSASVYLMAKTEGFTESEAEIEATLSFGRHLERFHVAVDLAYGQDPEAKERDGELAIAVDANVTRAWFVGVVGRARDALGSAGGKSGVVQDAFAGVSSTYVIGRFGITTSAGIAGVRLHDMPMERGPAATIAIGTAF